MNVLGVILISVACILFLRGVIFILLFPKEGVISYQRFHNFERGRVNIFFDYISIACAFAIYTVLLWLYSILLLPFKLLFHDFEFCESDKAEKTSTADATASEDYRPGLEKTWFPLQRDYKLLSPSYKVEYVGALIPGPAEAITAFHRQVGMNHNGLAFTGENDNFVIDLQAEHGMFSAIIPEVDVGFQLFPLKPALTLKWNNKSLIYKYTRIDKTYWTDFTLLGETSEEEVDKYLQWCFEYMEKSPIYIPFRIKRDKTNQVLYDENTCGFFAMASIDFLVREADWKYDEDAVNSCTRFNMFRTTDKKAEEETRFVDKMIVDYFSGLKDLYASEIAEFLQQEHEDLMQSFFQFFTQLLQQESKISFSYQMNENGKGVYVQLSNSRCAMESETFENWVNRNRPTLNRNASSTMREYFASMAGLSLE